jgi:outer membrane protein OmpA-like peptidoglycan-associated protein
MARDFEQQLAADLELELEDAADALANVSRLLEWEQPPDCPKTGNATASSFSRYSNSVSVLPSEERAKINAIAASIVANQRAGCLSRMRVRLIGHADRDIARERREPGFMLRISQQRALAVKTELERLLNNRALSSQIDWEVLGAADRQLAIANPRSELDRQRNRRVEMSITAKPVAPSDCSTAQHQRIDLARAAALHYMRTQLGRKEPVPTGVECFDPPTMPYVCDVRFSNSMVIEVEVRPHELKVLLSQANDEPDLLKRAPVCKFTYRCPPSGGIVFRESECAR